MFSGFSDFTDLTFLSVRQSPRELFRSWGVNLRFLFRLRLHKKPAQALPDNTASYSSQLLRPRMLNRLFITQQIPKQPQVNASIASSFFFFLIFQDP